MKTSPITIRRKNPPVRSGFTLIEVMLVVAIMAMMATMVLPRSFFSFDPPLRALQRTVQELSDLALDGYSVRLRMEIADRADRGRVVVEALTKVEDRFNPANSTLDWKPVAIRHPLEGADWFLDPEVIYFYSDGTCTPARILRADKNTRITNGETALLTVTGFLFELDGLDG
jgi:prepilin-type N-terminal cleavage/methylation domain-containing protein